METIIAPDRIQYIQKKKPRGCIFCGDSIRDDRLVVHEGRFCFVIMNKYPYTSGHVMVVPWRHVAEISDMTAEELQELMELTGRAVEILKEACTPEGFNVGMNLGKAAGAGVDAHLHMHIVPRWYGDTNFISTLSDTRVIPEDLDSTSHRLRTLFADKGDKR